MDVAQGKGLTYLPRIKLLPRNFHGWVKKKESLTTVPHDSPLKCFSRPQSCPANHLAVSAKPDHEFTCSIHPLRGKLLVCECKPWGSKPRVNPTPRHFAKGPLENVLTQLRRISHGIRFNEMFFSHVGVYNGQMVQQLQQIIINTLCFVDSIRKSNKRVEGGKAKASTWSLSNHDHNVTNFANLKNSSFAHFGRAVFTFVHFAAVVNLSTTWNDRLCSCVDDVSTSSDNTFLVSCFHL